jgi:hypothetical protein
VVPVQPSELGEPGEVGHSIELGGLEALGEHPAEVTPQQPLLPGRCGRLPDGRSTDGGAGGWPPTRAHPAGRRCRRGRRSRTGRRGWSCSCGGRSSGGSRRREEPSGRRTGRPPSRRSSRRIGPGTVRPARPRESGTSVRSVRAGMRCAHPPRLPIAPAPFGRTGPRIARTMPR